MMAFSTYAMDLLTRDPRLRILPLGARALFLLLWDALEQLPDRVFCLGDRLGSVADIALLVSASETEVGTHLETLLGTKLLTRRVTDGALMLPVGTPAEHGAVARQNGGLGGRPRRGETAEQARARRAQGNFKLPIVGGLSETEETQQKPSGAEIPRARATTASQKELAKQPREISIFAAEMANLAGLSPAGGPRDLRAIEDWIAAGISMALICDTITKVVHRESYSAGSVRSFRYFDKAIREAFAMQPQPGDAASKGRADQWEAWIGGGCRGPTPKLAA